MGRRRRNIAVTAQYLRISKFHRQLIASSADVKIWKKSDSAAAVAVAFASEGALVAAAAFIMARGSRYGGGKPEGLHGSVKIIDRKLRSYVISALVKYQIYCNHR
jgi:hypothetical protein